MGGGLRGLRRKAFLIGLGLGGLLELLFHWLEGGSEHGGSQLGNVPARNVEHRAVRSEWSYLCGGESVLPKSVEIGRQEGLRQ
jgi:hypothetical protein